MDLLSVGSEVEEKPRRDSESFDKPSVLSRRLLSVDVLRGLCVAATVLVNFPADWVLHYNQLAHAKWMVPPLLT